MQKLAVFVCASEQNKRTQAPLLMLSRLNLDQSQSRNTAKLAQCFEQLCHAIDHRDQSRFASRHFEY